MQMFREYNKLLLASQTHQYTRKQGQLNTYNKSSKQDKKARHQFLRYPSPVQVQKSTQQCNMYVNNPESNLQQHKIPLLQQQALDQIQETIQSLPSDLRYLKVFPYKSKPTQQNTSKPPHLLIYQDNDQLQISELISKYANEVNRTKDAGHMYWKLEGGYIMMKEKTVKQIKKQLRLDTLDGIQVYLDVLHELLLFSVDECHITTLISKESSYNKNAIEVEFILPDVKYSIYLSFQGEQQVKKQQEKLFTKVEQQKLRDEQEKNKKDQYEIVTARLAAEIQRIFAKQINPKNISLSYQQKKFCIINENIPFKKLYKDDRVKVTFNNKVVLPPPPKKNNTLLIIQGEAIKQNKNDYDDIKNKKLKDLLNQIEHRPNWSDYGLKIGDYILKPEQKFIKADHIMKNSKQNCIKFSGVLINEAQMFEAEQNNIRKLGKFDLQTVMDKKKTNLDLRQTCYKMIQQRAKKATHVYFKGKIENIKPIFLYTSQLQVKPSLKGNSAALYRNLNAFLRNQSFGQTTEKQYKQMWEYPFTNHLLEQLKNIQPVKNCVLYRGVNFEPKHKVGDKILYKQFNSSTPALQMAKSFAVKAMFHIKKSHSGKSIKQFSYFMTEQQVLFEPYCQFKVTKISTIVNDLIGKITIPLIEIEQIQKAPIPDSTALFLLWVDDKPQQVNKTWTSLTNIKKSSVMIPLLSTEQLKNWLNKNKDLLSDKTAEFVMVTNMTRAQRNVKNEESGIQAIKLFKQYLPENNILVYIGWIDATLQKLKKHNLLTPNSKIQVTNQPADLYKFLKLNGGLS